MDSSVIVDVTKDENVIALLEDNKLVELQRERRNDPCALSDIFLGKVSKVDRGLNAAFVNIGTDKDAFIPYSELGPTLASTTALLEKSGIGKKNNSEPKSVQAKAIDPRGNIEDVLKKGQRILVQITKEKINTKGATGSTELSIAGRMMVLVPFSEGVSISQKITEDYERNRLTSLVESIKPKGFKVVIRTFAFGKTVAALNRELQYLVNCWKVALEKLAQAKGPQRIHCEPDRVICFLRESLDDSYHKIVVNNQPLYHEMCDYLDFIGKTKEEVQVELHQQDVPIFDRFGISRQIKTLFGRAVTYKSGAYLVIDSTEAMHVVDVNSGSRSRKSSDQEETAFQVNMAAAEEVARQLRLRDIGGIIVIDFIDMDDATHRSDLYKRMEELMDSDKAAHTILPLSKFCLMQITRQRVRPAVTVKTEEVCPCCRGTGKTESSLLLTDEIEQQLITYISATGEKRFFLHVHPFVAAYLMKGVLGRTLISKWNNKHKVKVKVVEDQMLPLLKYQFYDRKRKQIDPNQG